MLTVAQAFERFIQDLRLREGEAREATRQQEFVFNAMRRRLGPKESILSGSYGRNTAIRPLHDIDLFLVFSDGASIRRTAPEDFLIKVKQALEAEFSGKQARLQNRSVNIDFTTTGIGFDVVPAAEDSRQRDVYWIPDRRSGEWIRSNPRVHQATCDNANERAGKKLKPLIKVVKRWNQLRQKPVPSFLLEVLACESTSTLSFQVSYAAGMSQLFAFMRDHVMVRCLEPARLGPPVNAGIEPGYLQQAQQRLTEAARKSVWAVELERRGDMSAAVDAWRELLGPDFPVR
ncbi:nucleotidyltransferase domain-containing protein [Corallococcus exercitus]|uniref:SMODS domain-containing nucleotidyltransferase n=1 Tax=Corallococcus exercitus TaxID=2316736 RepID=UPI0035D5094D